jgi:hypothetical protein
MSQVRTALSSVALDDGMFNQGGSLTVASRIHLTQRLGSVSTPAAVAFIC